MWLLRRRGAATGGIGASEVSWFVGLGRSTGGSGPIESRGRGRGRAIGGRNQTDRSTGIGGRDRGVDGA